MILMWGKSSMRFLLFFLKQIEIYMKIIDGLKESYTELVQKVSWPSKDELMQSSVIVLVASLLMASIVWLIDTIFEKLMTIVYDLF